MEGVTGTAHAGAAPNVEPEQCPVDLDAVPGRLDIQTSQEGLRREFAPEAPVRRGLRREIDPAFAFGDEPGRSVDILAYGRVRCAGPAGAGRRATAREAGGEQLGFQ